jgi:hypothetical protein
MHLIYVLSLSGYFVSGFFPPEQSPCVAKKKNRQIISVYWLMREAEATIDFPENQIWM